jgi:hypothetical protein
MINFIILSFAKSSEEAESILSKSKIVSDILKKMKGIQGGSQ